MNERTNNAVCETRSLSKKHNRISKHMERVGMSIYGQFHKLLLAGTILNEWVLSELVLVLKMSLVLETGICDDENCIF